MNTYKKDPDVEKLSYDLHFWIGEDSTQDEYGVAASHWRLSHSTYLETDRPLTDH
jgi:hypothetical protein